MRYSLANYILSIKPDDPEINALFGTISVGGEGSAIGSITVQTQQNIWQTTGYATGAWVHHKDLSRIGTCEVRINQLTDAVAKFKKMCAMFYQADYAGFTLSLSDNEGNKVCDAIDSYIVKIPAQEFGSQATDQTWSFTCGQIVYN